MQENAHNLRLFKCLLIYSLGLGADTYSDQRESHCLWRLLCVRNYAKLYAS